jgi:hypothetical protein
VVSFDLARANSDVPSFVSITHKKQRSEKVKTLLGRNALKHWLSGSTDMNCMAAYTVSRR